MKNHYNNSNSVDDLPLSIDTITQADIALIQASLNFDIGSTNGYDPERELKIRRIIIKLDKYM